MVNQLSKGQTPAVRDVRLRLAEVMTELNVSSEHTISRWEESCPYLFGAPFEAEIRTIPVTQKTYGGGTLSRTYKVKTWAPSDVDRIKTTKSEVAAGRVIDDLGIARLSTARAAEVIRKVVPNFFANTLVIWARPKKFRSIKIKGRRRKRRMRLGGCPYFDDRPLTAKVMGFDGCGLWFLEDEIIRLAAIIEKQSQGKYGEAEDASLTPTAAQRVYGWHPQVLFRWEQECVHLAGGKLMPLWVHKGKFAKRRRPRWKGDRRDKDAQTKTYLVRDLDAIKAARVAAEDARREGKTPFEGIYREQQGRRVNLPRAATELGISINTLTRYCVFTAFHPYRFLPNELRRRPAPPHPLERTIADRHLETLKAGLARSLVEPLPAGDWRTATEIAKARGLDEGGRIRLYVDLKNGVRTGKLEVVRRMRAMNGRQRWREVQFFDGGKVDEYLDATPRGKAHEQAVPRKGRGGYRPNAGRKISDLNRELAYLMGPPWKAGASYGELRDVVLRRRGVYLDNSTVRDLVEWWCVKEGHAFPRKK
jgi:hypothetical protein